MTADLIAFEAEPNAEHALILQAKSSSAAGAWELGSRLLRFRETGSWKKVTMGGGPFPTWKDYIVRGCNISVPSAYRYMAAAGFPKWAVLKHGLDAIVALKEIADLTAAEETVDEALALVLPTRDGGERPFTELSGNEVEAALRLFRDQAQVRRAPPHKLVSAEAEQARDRIREGAAAWLQPGQVMLRKIGGNDVVDVRAVPIERAREVFAAIAAALG